MACKVTINAKHLDDYLVYAAKRLHIEYSEETALYSNSTNNPAELIQLFINSEGYGEEKQGIDWDGRVKFWCRNGNVDCLYLKEDGTVTLLNSKEVNHLSTSAKLRLVPIFNSYLNRLNIKRSDLFTQVTQNTTQTTKKAPMKNLFEKLIDRNKEAALLGAKLSAGKTVNDLVAAKLYKALPFMSRLFTSKKAVAKQGLTKLVTANLVSAAVEVSGVRSDKLKFISEAMLDDALVTLTRDSKFLEELIGQVESAVTIPEGVLENITGETK